ncbi:MAG: N-acetyl-gamma-glutamyl-phosphate reductase [Rhodospirillaceae bacterium]|nr:MAG: N-acetyl-gamma-glutamyl-phosphate reductase [Rhodospirillaceae bacterium]
MTARIFIDGAVGTTGLQIKSRLENRDDIELVTLAEEVRKDASARADMLNSVDVAILCLPDAAAIDAAAMVTNANVKIIDASSAHRVADNWAYGFAELSPGQRDIIRHATRVSNPGCYAVASISMLQPLVSSGLIDADQGLSINAISGYSGGGKPLIADFEGGTDSETPFFVYGLSLAHKHVPEIQKHGGLNVRPIMVPSVGNFAQGMIVQLPLFADAAAVYDALASHYDGSRFVSVVKANDLLRIEPQALNGTNELRLHVCEADGQTVVMALLDNLGKGASGSCVQNLNIMLGVDEDMGL